MDQADISALLDTLTANTSAERFGEFLAAPHSAALPLPAAFDLPLVASRLRAPDPLLPSPSPSPPLLPLHLPPVPSFDLRFPLPMSAVTSLSPSSRSDPPIRKKRARTPPRHATLVTAAAAAAAAAAAVVVDPRSMSVASDVTSLCPGGTSAPASAPASVSASASTPPSASPSFSGKSPKPEPVKMEPAPLPFALATSPSRLSVPTSATVSASGSASSPSPSSALPKSHTRRCREKVTKQFEHLLEVLPPPPHGVEVKHKAQILEYTISIFRYLLLRRTALQTEIALASRTALRHWMNATIEVAAAASASAATCAASTSIAASGAPASRNSCAPQKPVPLAALLEPFVGLYCVKKSWTYGEMWLVDQESNRASLASCVFNTDDDDVLHRFDSFATVSRARFSAPAQLKSGIISRVLASRRPEWLCNLASDPNVFDRAPLAAEHGMSIAVAVPVMLHPNHCAGVLLFADLQPHSYSTSDLTTLLEYTSVLGSLYAQYVSGFHCLAPSHRPPHEAYIDGKPASGFEAELSPVRVGSDVSSEGLGFSGPDRMTNASPLIERLVAPSLESPFFGDSEFLSGH